MKRTTTLLLAAAGGALLWRRARRSADDPDGGVLDADEARALYDRLAPVYDGVAGAYALLGARRLHDRAVGALRLRPGDTAVSLGCGTGPNLGPLARAVGLTGRVVGVDLSAAMLAQARDRVRRLGLDNVELVRADVREFAFPEGLDGVLAVFALEMVPDYDAVVERAVAALRPGGRIAVSGLRRPDGWPEWAVRLGELVNRPFGVSRAYESFRPWEAVRRHAREVAYREAVLGAVYLSVGEAPSPDGPPRQHPEPYA